jgi:uronate dehydrogenase
MAKAAPVDPQDKAIARVGGPFAVVPLGQSGIAGIKAMSEGKK